MRRVRRDTTRGAKARRGYLCHGLPPPPADYFPKVIEQHGEAALRASRCRALRKRVNDAKQLTEPRNGANEALITKRIEKLTDRASRTPETGRLFADHRRHEPGSEVDRVKDELIRVHEKRPRDVDEPQQEGDRRPTLSPGMVQSTKPEPRPFTHAFSPPSRARARARARPCPCPISRVVRVPVPVPVPDFLERPRRFSLRPPKYEAPGGRTFQGFSVCLSRETMVARAGFEPTTFGL